MGSLQHKPFYDLKVKDLIDIKNGTHCLFYFAGYCLPALAGDALTFSTSKEILGGGVCAKHHDKVAGLDFGLQTFVAKGKMQEK